MRIDVVTLFPEMVQAALAFGMPARALKLGRIDLRCHNPRDDASDPYRSVDERPYGGGPGMVMTIEPLRQTLQRVRAADPSPAPVIYLSPQGPALNQRKVEQLAVLPRCILLCGRYEGVDQRLLDAEVDEELSIGDYVLSGGELGALVVIDAVSRLLPGVLHSAASAAQDSFSDGLLDCPHYSRPEHHELGTVPPVLLSGDHAAIACWRRKQALLATWLKRPDLLETTALNAGDAKLLQQVIDEYRCAQMLL
jgi:tRNA (guanine37-N1)-methyltransferase